MGYKSPHPTPVISSILVLSEYFHHDTISNSRAIMTTPPPLQSACVPPTYTPEAHVNSVYKNLCNLEKVVQELPRLKAWLTSIPPLERRNRIRTYIATTEGYTELLEKFKEINESHVGDLSTDQQEVVAGHMNNMRVAGRALFEAVEEFEMALEGYGLEME